MGWVHDDEVGIFVETVEFLTIHAETLWQGAFFKKSIWSPKGLLQRIVLAFIYVVARWVYCSPCSFQPNPKWMEQLAEVFLGTRLIDRPPH